MPDDLQEVIASGAYRASLEAIRDELATLLASCRSAGDARAAAPLAKQLTDVLATLDALPNAERKSTSDDLRARRAARRAAASS